MSRARRRKPWAFCVSIVLMTNFRFSFVRVSGTGGRVVDLVDMRDGEAGDVWVAELSFQSTSERPNIDLAKLIGSTDPIYLLNLLVNCTIITINGC